jgi:hypothetical protein
VRRVWFRRFTFAEPKFTKGEPANGLDPALMGKVQEVVYRILATQLIRKAGFTKHSAQTGDVTLIQHFGSTLNLNLNFHMLFLDVFMPKTNTASCAFAVSRLPPGCFGKAAGAHQ